MYIPCVFLVLGSFSSSTNKHSRKYKFKVKLNLKSTFFNRKSLHRSKMEPGVGGHLSELLVSPRGRGGHRTKRWWLNGGGARGQEEDGTCGGWPRRSKTTLGVEEHDSWCERRWCGRHRAARRRVVSGDREESDSLVVAQWRWCSGSKEGCKHIWQPAYV
jgi:hypothetical protein